MFNLAEQTPQVNLSSQSFAKIFGDKHDLKKAFGLSESFAKRTRRNECWLEGIHVVRVPKSNKVLYNLPLIKDWLVNGQTDPVAHQRAVEAFQSSLLSNQKKRKGSTK